MMTMSSDDYGDVMKRGATRVSLAFFMSGVLVAYIRLWGANGTVPPGGEFMLIGMLIPLHVGLHDLVLAAQRYYYNRETPGRGELN